MRILITIMNSSKIIRIKSCRENADFTTKDTSSTNIEFSGFPVFGYNKETK